jgi:hypothetical protein
MGFYLRFDLASPGCFTGMRYYANVAQLRAIGTRGR